MPVLYHINYLVFPEEAKETFGALKIISTELYLQGIG